MSIKKCGNFMEKDGIVVKRPGKRFVCPPMPEKMKIPSEKLCGNVREDIDQMNALREQKWQADRKEEYAAMKRLYYFQELVRFVRRSCAKIICIVPGTKKKKDSNSAYICTSPIIYASTAGVEGSRQHS